MTSETSGWALADDGGATSVVRTADGGVRWTVVLRAGRQSVANDFEPTAVDFHDSATAWVLGVLGDHSTASRQVMAIASTSDGGTHWTMTPTMVVDGEATKVEFVDPSRGWVFATPSAGGVIGSQDTTLYRTVDGGVHWQVVKPPSQVRQVPGVYGTLPEACAGGGPLDAPSFVDPLHGWLAGFCDRLYLYVSRDGGLSWASQALPPVPAPAGEPNPPQYVTSSPRFTSAVDGYLVVHRGFTTGGGPLQESAVYVTHDAGATWTPFRLPAIEFTIDFIDPQHGWVVFVNPAGSAETFSLYKTGDGGRTWALASGAHDYFTGELSFVSPETGFLAVQVAKGQPGELFKTTDGGATWVLIAAAVG